jgi:hypothetical protein
VIGESCEGVVEAVAFIISHDEPFCFLV